MSRRLSDLQMEYLLFISQSSPRLNRVADDTTRRSLVRRGLIEEFDKEEVRVFNYGASRRIERFPCWRLTDAGKRALERNRT